MSGDSTSKTPRFVGFPPSIEIAPGATRRVDLDAYFEGVSGFSFTVRSSLDPATATATAIGTRLIVEAAEEGETKLIVLASEPGNPANFAQGLIPVVVSSQFAPSSGKGSDPGGHKAPHARHPRDRRLFRRGLPPLSDGGSPPLSRGSPPPPPPPLPGVGSPTPPLGGISTAPHGRDLASPPGGGSPPPPVEGDSASPDATPSGPVPLGPTPPGPTPLGTTPPGPTPPGVSGFRCEERLL